MVFCKGDWRSKDFQQLNGRSVRDVGAMVVFEEWRSSRLKFVRLSPKTKIWRGCDWPLLKETEGALTIFYSLRKYIQTIPSIEERPPKIHRPHHL